MRSRFVRFLTLFVVFVFQISYAQDLTVSGVVKSQSDGMPLPGVSVVVSGTTNGVVSDMDGKYSIKAKKGEKLVFTFIGMQPQTIEVAQSVINVSLKDETVQLENVVVEAYRTTTKVKSNVATSTVNAATIESRPNASFVQTLQAQVPGLNIQTGSGQPGAGSTIILRGLGSINGNVEPLFVIDGVPQNGDVFRSINPNEIENVSVLKDAGATAIYGNRGANGVIVVTTKKGKFGSGLAFSYTTTTGLAWMQDHDYNLMDAKQLLSLEKARGVGMGSTMSDADIAAYNVNTDWNKVFFRTGVTKSHTLNMTSGGENISSFTSFGFADQQGILENTDLTRFNFRNNLNGKSNNKKFTYNTNLSINYSKRNEAGSLGTGGVNQNYVLGANNSAPYVDTGLYTGSQDLLDLYNANGTLLYTPLFLMDKLNTFSNKIDELKAIAGVGGTYNFTDALSFSSKLSLDYTQSTQNTFQDPISFNSFLFLDPGQEFGGFESNTVNRTLLANVNTQLKYVKTFADKHTVEASVFTEYFKAHNKNFGYTQNGLDPKVSGPESGAGYIGYDGNPYYVPEVFAGKANAGLFSYFGFVDYDYDSKYGISATVRRDASYRFNTTNRWGTFYSVAGRWNIDQEKFMEGSVFDVLKLRASYGTTGNQDIIGTGMFGAANFSRTLYDATTGYANQPGYGVVQLGNDELKWETITQANLGLDFEVFNNRLRGSFDVYQKKTTDLYQGVRISAINAITQINANYGSLRNRGAEVVLAYDLVRNPSNDFKVTLNFNGSYNKNEIMDLPDGDNTWDGESLTANFEGNMLNQFYLLEYAGVNPVNGNMLFSDGQGGVTENPDPATNRKLTGKSAIPVYQGGFGFDIDYKGFYLTTLFSYVKDVWRFDYDYEGLVDPSNIGIFNMSTDILNAWTPTNTDTHIPALNAANTALDDFSDRFLVDASYVRLRNVSFGYNVPKRFLDKTFISGLKLFAQGENLVTWSKWRGWDAESNRGADQYQYPTPRMVTLGLELKF